jgi:hypothetical protein
MRESRFYGTDLSRLSGDPLHRRRIGITSLDFLNHESYAKKVDFFRYFAPHNPA